MTASTHAVELATTAATAADDKLGEDIAVVDVSEQLIITDCFVIVTGDNERHVQALVDEIEDQLRDKHQVKPLRREGTRESRWALIDYGEIVVHVFRRDERGYYGLDRLWRDCPLLAVEGIETFTRGDDTDGGIDIFEVDSIDQIPLADPAPDEAEL